MRRPTLFALLVLCACLGFQLMAVAAPVTEKQPQNSPAPERQQGVLAPEALERWLLARTLPNALPRHSRAFRPATHTWFEAIPNALERTAPSKRLMSVQIVNSIRVQPAPTNGRIQANEQHFLSDHPLLQWRATVNRVSQDQAQRSLSASDRSLAGFQAAARANPIGKKAQ